MYVNVRALVGIVQGQVHQVHAPSHCTQPGNSYNTKCMLTSVLSLASSRATGEQRDKSVRANQHILWRQNTGTWSATSLEERRHQAGYVCMANKILQAWSERYLRLEMGGDSKVNLPPNTKNRKFNVGYPLCSRGFLKFGRWAFSDAKKCYRVYLCLILSMFWAKEKLGLPIPIRVGQSLGPDLNSINPNLLLRYICLSLQ
jgi:hypothetical protein